VISTEKLDDERLMHYICNTATFLVIIMKTSTLPAVRVTPETRALIESVLKDGESLSTFIEDSAKRQASWRKEDEEFCARAVRSSELVKVGKMCTYSMDEVMKGLEDITAQKKRSKTTAKQTTSA